MNGARLRQYGAMALWTVLALASLAIGLGLLPIVVPLFTTLVMALLVILWLIVGVRAILRFLKRPRTVA